MYSRTWHGITPIEQREEFERYEYETGVKEALKTEGNLGAYLKVVEKDGYAHFFLCTMWDGLESMRRFAGPDLEKAVDYPDDIKYGLISDPVVIIQEVLSDRNSVTSKTDAVK